MSTLGLAVAAIFAKFGRFLFPALKKPRDNPMKRLKGREVT